jgi:mannose-6-phosphate isomerase-like protein (cupin superfamily)
VTVERTLGEVAVLEAGGGPELSIVRGDARAQAIVWPGMGASLRSMHRISLGPQSRTVEMQHVSDAVYYVISGAGDATDAHVGRTRPLIEGSMIHVDAGTPYELIAGPEGLELVGGPAPADPSLYSSSQAAPS